MDDQIKTKQDQVIRELTPELKATLNETRAKLQGSDRRRFMAQIVLALGQGGQSRAQRELGWNRNVINAHFIRHFRQSVTRSLSSDTSLVSTV